MTAPNATTVVVNMSKPVNPTWMEEDILGPSRSCPPRVGQGLGERTDS